MSRLRVYVDTSVIGGCFDEEFAVASQAVMDLARSGRLILLVSDLVTAELAKAPAQVRRLVESLPTGAVEETKLTQAVLELRDADLERGIVSGHWADDAAHVAGATVARADAIVSWNFRHIVKLDKIKAYNQVNLANGYGILTIVSPKEVVGDDTEQDSQDV